jgi:hypothetical protein
MVERLGNRTSGAGILLLRCVGWAVVTGACTGGALLLGAELTSLPSGHGLQAAWIWDGAIYGAILAVPIGCMIALAILLPLMDARDADEPAAALRWLHLRVVAVLDLLVVATTGFVLALHRGGSELPAAAEVGALLLFANAGAYAPMRLARDRFSRR